MSSFLSSTTATTQLVVCIAETVDEGAGQRQENPKQLPLVIVDKAADPQRFTVYNGKESTAPPALSRTATPVQLPEQRTEGLEGQPSPSSCSTCAPVVARAVPERSCRLTVSANGTIARQTVADVVTRGVDDVNRVLNGVLETKVPSMWDNEDVILLNHFTVASRSPSELTHRQRARDEITQFRKALGQFLERACRNLWLESVDRTTPFFTHTVQIALTALPRRGKGSGFQPDTLRGITPSLLQEQHASESRQTASVDSEKICASIPDMVARAYDASRVLNGDLSEQVIVVVSLVQSLQGHPTRTSRLRVLDLGPRTLEDPIIPSIHEAYAVIPAEARRPSMPNNAAGQLARRSTRTAQRPTPPPSFGMTPPPHFRIAFEDTASSEVQSVDDDFLLEETDADILRRVCTTGTLRSLKANRPLHSNLCHVVAMVHISSGFLYEAIDHLHRCTFVKDDAPFVVEDSFLDCLELLQTYKMQRDELKKQRDELVEELKLLSAKEAEKGALNQITLEEVGMHASDYRRRNTAVLLRERALQETYESRMDISVFAVDGVVYQSVSSGLRVNIAERNLDAARTSSTKAEANRRHELASAQDALDSARDALKAAQDRLASVGQQLASDMAKIEAVKRHASELTEAALGAFEQTRTTTLRLPTSAPQVDKSGDLQSARSSNCTTPRPPTAGSSAARQRSSDRLSQPRAVAGAYQRREALLPLVREAERMCETVESEVTTLHKHKANHTALGEAMLEYRLLSERVLKELLLLAQRDGNKRDGISDGRPASARGTVKRREPSQAAPVSSR